MANDKRRNHKVKKDEGIKSKKKTVTQDASPETSSSRRSSRETSSSKQAKEIPPSTRKSLRLEKNKPPDSPPIQRKSNRTQEKITTTPLKKYNRRKKHTAVGSSGTKKLVEDPASSSMKSKNDKVKKSLKMDSKEDQKEEKQSLDVGGRKRKRVTTSGDKALPRSQRKKTESGNDKDKESQDDSSQATSSSNKDVENSKNTNSGSVSVEDKGDDDDDVEERSDNTGEESTLKTSEAQCSTSNSSLTNFNVQEISDDVEEEEKEEEESPNSIKFEGVPVPDDAVKEPPTDTDISMEEKQVEHIGESIENGNVTPISGTISSSKSDTTTKKTDPDVCKDVKEFWVPVPISNVQLEQYCSMLLTNSMALSSCSKSDTVGALHDILVSNRKCCDHPYIVDQSLQAALTKDLEPAKFLEVGIKASGKLQFLDLILLEMKKRELRVLILFQPLSGSGKDSTSLGDILDDFIRQRFGEDSYERVDYVVTTSSKRQAALNNFNNKEMGRFIFLLDYRACLPSIKLSLVDTIIIFDSDWNPANDLRALQKIAIDSHPEKTKIFRLYTSCTLEEKILKLSEQNVTIDKGLQNVSRSTCDALLMWGATYLFSKLTEFHCANILPEEWEGNDLKEEFLNLVSEKSYSGKLIVSKGKQSCESGTLGDEMPGGEQPHTFWKKLLVGRDPSWKYLTLSTPRQRKRPQFYEHSLVNTNVGSDDVGRKRKKTATVTEKGETKEVCTVVSSEGSQLSPGESISCAVSCNETSFRYLLKLNIAELCRVLKLSEEVRTMVEKFLEYVIENYQVNKEPANTLQAFLISLCWIGSELLNTKLDRKQTLLSAKKRLNFTCEEEETNSVYLKLTSAKDMFLLHTENQKKTNLLNEINPHVVKVEIPDSSEDEYVTISPDTSDIPEDPNNNSNSLPIPSSDVKSPVIQPLITPPLPTNPEIQNESTQDKDAEKVDGPLVAQQNEGPPPVLENTTTVDDPNHTATQLWQNLFNLQESENYNRGPPRMISCTDPLQIEMEKLSELKNTVNNFYEAIKVKINSEYEKEKAELLARLIRKYEDKSQKAELAFQSKRKEIDVNFNKAAINKILADAFRSKCRDLNPFETSQMERELQHFNQFQSQHSSSTGQSSRNHQVNMGHPTLQVVHQSANLFSNSPTTARPPPPSNNHHPITPSPPFNHHPIFPSPPTRPPPNITTTTTTANRPPPTISPITPSTTRPLPQINPLSKPPPNITTTTPSFRNPRVIGEIRAPAPHIRPFKPSTSMSPHDHASHRVILNHLTSTTLPPSSATQPPPSQTPINHNSHPPQPPPPPLVPPSQTPTNHPDRPVAPPPPLSTQVPSEQQPPATSSSSSLPPMPSVSISQSGLYSSSGRPDIMRLSAMDLLMDVNEQAGFYQTNVVPSPPHNIQPTLSGKKGGDGDLVCLSDDD